MRELKDIQDEGHLNWTSLQVAIEVVEGRSRPAPEPKRLEKFAGSINPGSLTLPEVVNAIVDWVNSRIAAENERRGKR